MFTGIIETVGQLRRIARRGEYLTLAIAPNKPLENVILGESIAVDGCCLTVTRFDRNGFDVEVSPESVRSTIIGGYQTGRLVNLELAMRADGRFGGHLVSGHIDCAGEIVRAAPKGNGLEIAVQFPEKYRDLVVEKGSIAIDGVSLTINRVNGNIFDVNIIPHTRRETTADRWKEGAMVNLEFDLVGKYILQRLNYQNPAGVTLEKLAKSGWNI